MKKEIPKGSKPFRSVKGTTHMGTKYLVRIVDERAREGSPPGFGGALFWENKRVERPTLSLGWLLPNNFEAEWNSLRVCFRVELFKVARKPRWAISTYSVEPLKATSPIDKVDHLPLHTFLEAAIQLATVQCVTYPPNYQGEVVGTDGEALPQWRGWKITPSTSLPDGEVLVIGWLSETPREIMQEFLAVSMDKSEQKRLSNKKRLQVVAKAWKAAPERGKASAVEKALAEVGDFVGLERVKQLIKEARKVGLIPPSKRSKG